MKKTLYKLALGLLCSQLHAEMIHCPQTVQQELLPNGNFEQGNTGFLSGMSYSTGTSSIPPDSYTLGISANSYNPYYFAFQKDHTSGSGLMFIADINDNTREDNLVYYNNIPVEAGKTYFFSFWASNLTINNLVACPECVNNSQKKIANSPIIKLKANNVILQIVHIDSTSNIWRQYYATYRAAVTTTITLAITDVRGGNSGNDIALDDISFKNSCDAIQNDEHWGGTRRVITSNTYLPSCEVAFPYQIKTDLSPSAYAFNWYDNATLVTEGIKLDDQKTSASSASYTLNTMPKDNSFYFVCYDSIGDGITCAMRDSIIFGLSYYPFIKSSTLCGPIDLDLNTEIDTAAATFSWTKDGSTQVIGTSSSLHVTEAGNYEVFIDNRHQYCANKKLSISVTQTGASYINAEISVPCNGDGKPNGSLATLSPRTSGTGAVNLINGMANVAWYTSEESTTSVATANSSTGIALADLSGKLQYRGNCPNGGLFIEDKNPALGLVPLINECTMSTMREVYGEGAGYQKFNSTKALQITSLDVYLKAYNNSGENITVGLFLCVPAIGGGFTVVDTLAIGTFKGYNKTTLSLETIYGSSKIIKPTAYGYILLKAYDTNNPDILKPVGFASCHSIPNNMKDVNGYLTLGDLVISGGNAQQLLGAIFNLKFKLAENLNPCKRTWVCASCNVVTELSDVSQYPNNIEIYPNPAHKTVTIGVKTSQMYSYDVFNMYGEKMYTTQEKTGTDQIDLTNYVPGIYSIKLNTGTTLENYRLVID